MADNSWTPARDTRLRAMLSEGMSLRAMAAELDVCHRTVFKRIRRLGLHKLARRAATGAGEQHRQFVELLKSGLSVAEAKRQLGTESPT